MAECRFEMQKMGLKGYVDYVGDLSREISAFSANELKSGRGTIKDETMDSAIREIIMGVTITKVDGAKHKGFFIRNPDMLAAWNKTQRGSLNNASLLRAMRTMGWIKENVYGLGRGWLFPIDARDINSVNESIVKYMAFAGHVKFSKQDIETAATDKLFNTAVRRAAKKITPSDGDTF